MNPTDLFDSGAQELIDDIRQKYRITQLTLVNSAKQAWAEIDVSDHLAIFGKNNVGKTSLVSAIKLALYPEDSFTSCESKFNFTNKDGKFTKEQSYLFYFPSYESFIIMEVENPYGRFCMVLFKNSGAWQYGRYFVPAPYEVVSKLFWNFQESRFNDNILAKNIIVQLKKLGGIHPDRLEEVSRLIYAGHQGTPEQGKYCIIPLINGSSPDSIAAFRNLYQLAFDIAQSDKATLPRAIATIIEMNRGRKKEQLNTNFTAILSAHEQLKSEMGLITALDNNESKWGRIDKGYNDYLIKRDELRSAISASLPSIKSELNELVNDRAEAKGELHSATRNHSNQKIKTSESNNKLVALKAELAKTRRDLTKTGEKLNKANNFKSKYSSSETLTSILTYQEEDLVKLELEIKSLKSEEDATLEFKRLTEEKSQKSNERKQLQSNLEVLGNSYLDTLPQHQSDALYSINAEMAVLPSVLSDSTRSVMDGLANETRILDNTLFLGDTSLSNIRLRKYDGKLRQEELTHKIKNLNEWLFDASRKLEELKGFLSGDSDIPALIENKEKELRSAQVEISCLRNLEAYKEQWVTGNLEITHYDESIAVLSLELEEDEALLDQYRHELKVIEDIIERSRPRVEFLKNAESQVDATALNLKVLLNDEVEIMPFGVFDHQQLRAITDMAAEEQKVWNVIIVDLREFLVDTSEDQGFNSGHIQESLSSIIESQRVRYSQLPERKNMLSASILSHKSELDNQLQELYEAKKTVQIFVDNLNTSIAAHSISNLDSFTVDIGFDTRFSQLMKSLDGYNLHDSNLIEESFYTKLTSFCDSFFKEKTRTIDLEKIINKVTYKYLLTGKTEYETKSQSGGTSSTITALILATLLKEISPNYTKVRFPIVVDEIGTQSGNNIASTYNAMQGLDFTLLCATPEPIPSVVDLIGRQVVIGKLTIKKPLVEDCHSLILNSLSERFGKLCDA